jgi:Outer membrane protein beta-barrel domain
MKNNKSALFLSSGLGLLLFMMSAFSFANPKDSSLSIGMSLDNVNIDDENFSKKNLGQSFHIGYRFSEGIGGELGFIDFGSVVLQGSGVFKDSIPSEVDATYISLMSYLVLSDSLDLYGKMGLLYSSISFSSFAALEEEIPDQSIFFGVGGKYAAAPGVNIIGEFSIYQIEAEYAAVRQLGDTIEMDSKITAFSLGAEWVF